MYIGDCLALSVQLPSHLQKIGLLKKEDLSDDKTNNTGRWMISN